MSKTCFRHKCRQISTEIAHCTSCRSTVPHSVYTLCGNKTWQYFLLQLLGTFLLQRPFVHFFASQLQLPCAQRSLCFDENISFLWQIVLTQTMKYQNLFLCPNSDIATDVCQIKQNANLTELRISQNSIVATELIFTNKTAWKLKFTKVFTCQNSPTGQQLLWSRISQFQQTCDANTEGMGWQKHQKKSIYQAIQSKMSPADGRVWTTLSKTFASKNNWKLLFMCCMCA